MTAIRCTLPSPRCSSGAGGDAAHSLNLASAVEAAVACGLLTLVATECRDPSSPALGSALLFAGPYTFWSQSIIAELYALHMLFIGLTLGLLCGGSSGRPCRGSSVFRRLRARVRQPPLDDSVVPVYALFLLTSAPRGWRSLFTPGG